MGPERAVTSVELVDPNRLLGLAAGFLSELGRVLSQALLLILIVAFFQAEQGLRDPTFQPGGTAERVARDVRQYLVITALTGLGSRTARGTSLRAPQCPPLMLGLLLRAAVVACTDAPSARRPEPDIRRCAAGGYLPVRAAPRVPRRLVRAGEAARSEGALGHATTSPLN